MIKIEIAQKELSAKLEMWLSFAKVIAQQRADGAEVVLHDLSDPAHSVIFVANGTVTDRHVGQGLRHLVREVLEAQSRGDDDVPDYWYYWKEKLIWSVTQLVRDDDNQLIGALCVNKDVTSRISDFETLKETLPGLENVSLRLPKKGEVYFKNAANVPEKKEAATQQEEHSLFALSQKIIESVARDMGLTEGAPSRELRLKYLKDLEERGVFLLKGSVEKVASVLGLSKVTIYSDLQSMKKKEGK